MVSRQIEQQRRMVLRAMYAMSYFMTQLLTLPTR
jgi:hypothetical protein